MGCKRWTLAMAIFDSLLITSKNEKEDTICMNNLAAW